jgi:hypothetical protein
MVNLRRVLIVDCLLLLAAHSVHAEYFSGVLLNKYCNSQSDYEKGMCLGYIVGVVDSFKTTSTVKGEKKIFCIPQGVTSGQLVLVLKKSMQEHPETLHLPASAHTLSALTAAFPCSQE